MTSPSPNSVVQRLVKLSAMLDSATEEIAVLDDTAVRAKGRYQVKFARSFLEATGAVDTRKQIAVRDCADEWLDYEIAEAKTRACKERIRTLRDQIEIGRSLGAAVRSEWAASGYTNP